MSAKSARHGTGKGVVPKFLAYFFGSALLVLSIGVLLFLSERENRLESLAEQEQGRLRLQTDYVEREIREVSSDLLALSLKPALTTALSHGIGEAPEQLSREDALLLAEDIENFVRAKGVYDELLLHDRRGRELLRMEKTGDDPVVVFPELATWETEAPPVTLESLAGDRVRFWMPETGGDPLFFAAAVTVDDRALGSLTLAYRSRHLLGKMGEQRIRAMGDFRILDRQGRSLFAAAAAGGGDTAFDPTQAAPELWRAIQGGDQGQIHDGLGLSTYNTLAPSRWLNAGEEKLDEAAATDAWKLVSHVPSARIAAAMDPYFQQLVKIYLVVLSVLLVGSLLLSMSRRRSVQARHDATASQERYHRLLDSARELVITASLESEESGTAQLLDLNRAARELFGYDATSMAKMSLSELVTERSLEDLRRHLESARIGRASAVEIEVIDSRGRNHIVEIGFQRSVAEDGQTGVLRGTGRDVGAHKRTEGKLAEAEYLLHLERSFFDELTRSAPADDARTLYAFFQALGLPGGSSWFARYGRAEAGDLRLVEAWGEGRDAAENAESLLPESLPPHPFLDRTGSPVEYLACKGEQPFGVALPAPHVGCLVFDLDGDGEELILALMAKDPADTEHLLPLLERLALHLRARRQAARLVDTVERERSEAAAAAEESKVAAESGTGCLLGVAARLRRPAKELAKRCEALLSESGESADRDELEVLSYEADRMFRSVEEVLTFASIEDGRAKSMRETFAWRDVLKESLGVVAPMATAKGIALRAEIEKQIPDQVVGDPYELRQVLDQLLDNALRHTEEGEVLVSTQLGREEGDGTAINFMVRDSGPGISDQQQQDLFDSFAPGGSGRRTGCGFGLYLAWRLVQRMGGRLWVQSSAGQGSTFHFSVFFGSPSKGAQVESSVDAAPVVEGAPAPEVTQEPSAESIPRTEAPPLPSMNVLVADTSESSRMNLMLLLEAQGHRARVVDSGIAAIETIAQEDYDAVLLAAQMPEMDGLTAARAIRDYEKSSGGHLPLVAMSAEALGGDRSRCEAAGMDHYLSKPVEADELLAVMTSIAGEAAREAPVSPVQDSVKERKTMNLETDLSIFDRAAAMDRVGDDLELLIDLAGMFLEDCQTFLSDIESGLANGDSDLVHRSAHQLKGAVGNFSAQRAYDAAFTLERMGDNGELDEAPAAFEILKSELARLEPILSNL